MSGTALAQPVNPPDPTETQSVGSSPLSVTIPTLYRVSGILDLTTGNYAPNGADLTMSDDVCVYTNTAGALAGQYRVNLHGITTCSGGACPATPADVFAISNDTNNQGINYTAFWNQNTSTAGRLPVGSVGGTNATNAANLNAHQTSPACDSTSNANANFSVTFTEAALLAVRAGAYTGTLTITIVAPL